MKKGQETSNGYLCINILEETEWTSFLCLDQVPLEDTIIEVTPLLVPNFLMRLLDLEFRGLCKLPQVSEFYINSIFGEE